MELRRNNATPPCGRSQKEVSNRSFITFIILPPKQTPILLGETTGMRHHSPNLYGGATYIKKLHGIYPSV